MSGLLVSLWLAMQIEVAGSCPSAQQIEGELATLLPPDFAADSSDRAVIAEDGESLTISLARADGRSAARRQLSRTGTCAEQAETVAVMLAVWEAQIHPEISLRLDRIGGRGAGRCGGAAAGRSRGRRSRDQRRRPPPERSCRPWGRASSVRGSPTRSRREGASTPPWACRIGRCGRGSRSRVSEGTAWASRPARRAGGGRTSPSAPTTWFPSGAAGRLALGAGGVVGVLTATGSGFSSDRTARSVDVGAEIMVRVELKLGVVRPWLGVGLLTWLRRQTVEVTGEKTSAALPRIEPLIALGADFCWRT